ncbi:tetratricopeptide repeat protein [Mesorhizobium sp. ANAO-SY3R2]|uniref:tetratricopeptide repeat protein n=1 Tax=Mesorhizobium sp. ANAO-SY3R2 TaxID=3166644 RepID=UPI0036720C67
MVASTPAAPAVREALERLVASETFARSDRARKLLRYLVERELAGEAERLKGFAIAVDVFGRDAEFDSATDAVVRVQAGRLRELLAQYYAAEGADDPVRIAIPRGSYVPTYEATAECIPEAPGPDEAQPPETAAPAEPLPEQAERAADVTRPDTGYSSTSFRRQLRYFWAAMALVIAMLGILVFRNIGAPTGAEVADFPGPTASISGAIDQLPAVHIHSGSDGGDTARVSTVLRTALSGFDSINLIARNRDEAEKRADATDFDFTVNPGPSSGTVLIELQHMASGRILMSRVLTAQEIGPDVIDERIAEIVTSAIPVSGLIYAYIEQNRLQSGLVSCLLLSDDFYMEQSATKHRAAYQCLQELSRRGAKSPIILAQLASLQLEAVTAKYPYPPDATSEAANALAHNAVQMGTASPYAHRALGYLQSRTGDPTEAIHWIRKAYELNTYDLTMAAGYGYALVLSGSYSEGVPIIKRAAESTSAHPVWWDYGLFLGEFMLGNRHAAARAANTLATTKRPHYLAARLVAAHFVGDEQLATALAKEISDTYPAFASDPAAVFTKSKYPEELTRSLTKALRAAGLGQQG